MYTIEDIIILLKKILQKQEEITNSLDILIELLTDVDEEVVEYDESPIVWHSTDEGTVECSFYQTYTN